MAKKKTIDLRSVDPTPVPAGDVNIIYNGTRIGGFSEDTEATLKTGGTHVLHDIYVNYEKNAPLGNIVNITNNSSGNPSLDAGLITSDGIYAENPYNIPSGNSKLFVYNAIIGTEYRVRIAIFSESDNYTITVNGETVAFSREVYFFSDVSTDSPITGQTYNVVITDKE